MAAAVEKNGGVRGSAERGKARKEQERYRWAGAKGEEIKEGGRGEEIDCITNSKASRERSDKTPEERTKHERCCTRRCQHVRGDLP
jgi:hypothetical protein